MRYLIPLLALVACGVDDDASFDPMNPDSWGQIDEGADRQAPPDPLLLEISSNAPAGAPLTITVSEAIVYDEIGLVMSTGGLGYGPCYMYFGGSCFDVAFPIRPIGYAVAGDDGMAEFNFVVPAAAPTLEVCFQAATARGAGGAESSFSNTVCYLVQADADGDGLGDEDELAMGTDPYNPDTDFDFYVDGVDCDPLDPGRNSICGTFINDRATGDMYIVDVDAGTTTYVCTMEEPASGMWGGDGRLFASWNNQAPYPTGGSIVEVDPETCETLNGPHQFNLDGYGWSEAGTRGTYVDGLMLLGIDQGCDGVVWADPDTFDVVADAAGFCHSRWNFMYDGADIWTNERENLNMYDDVSGETFHSMIDGDPYGSQNTSSVGFDGSGRLIKITADTWDYPPTMKAFEIDPATGTTTDLDVDLSMFSGSNKPHGFAVP